MHLSIFKLLHSSDGATPTVLLLPELRSIRVRIPSRIIMLSNFFGGYNNMFRAFLLPNAAVSAPGADDFCRLVFII